MSEQELVIVSKGTVIKGNWPQRMGIVSQITDTESRTDFPELEEVPNVNIIIFWAKELGETDVQSTLPGRRIDKNQARLLKLTSHGKEEMAYGGIRARGAVRALEEISVVDPHDVDVNIIWSYSSLLK